MAGAAQEGEDENYWPGFVDALTTMVMVLTFIMMILGITVFSLSQNVSKALLADVAKAIDIEAKPSDFSEELAKRIVAAIVAQRNDIDGQKRKAQDIATDKPHEERSQRETVLSYPGEKHLSQAPAELKPLGAGAAAGATEAALTIVFQPNAAHFDDAVKREIVSFVTKSRDAEFIIRAFAVENGGTISEARRLAYYRAMLIRQELIKAGLKPGQVQAQIDDSGDAANRSVVRVLGVRKQP